MKKWITFACLLLALTSTAVAQSTTIPDCPRITGSCPVDKYVCVYNDTTQYRCEMPNIWTAIGGGSGGATPGGTNDGQVQYKSGTSLAAGPDLVWTETTNLFQIGGENGPSQGASLVVGKNGQPGQVTVSSAISSGSIIWEGSNGVDGYTLRLVPPSLTASQVITLPNETGTVCTTGSVCSGYSSATQLATNDSTINEAGDLVSWFKLKDVPDPIADGLDATGEGGGGYSQILEDGNTNPALTQYTTLNFAGPGITCVNNSNASRTDCTVPSDLITSFGPDNRTGNIDGALGDYTASIIGSSATGTTAATTVQAAIIELTSEKAQSSALATSDGTPPNLLSDGVTTGGLVSWFNLLDVPADFADGIDGGGTGSGDPVLISGSAVDAVLGVNFTESTGIDITHTGAANPEGAAISWDSGELESVTWGGGANATVTHTFAVSGTDITVAHSSASDLSTFSSAIKADSFETIAATDDTRGVTFTDNTTTCADPASGSTSLCSIGGEFYLRDTSGTARELLNTAGGSYGDFTCTGGTCTVNVAPASSFIELDDVPQSYGTEGQVPAINATTDGLEWVDAIPATITAAAQHDVLVYDGSTPPELIDTSLPDCDTAATSKLLYSRDSQTFTCGTDQTSSETNTLTTVTTGIADDQIPVGSGSSVAAYATVPDCDTAGTSKLLYDQTTNAFSCGTDQTSAGGTITDETYNATNFNGDTTNGVSQDDLYDQLHIGDEDDDGKISVLDIDDTVNAAGEIAIDTTANQVAYYATAAAVLDPRQILSVTLLDPATDDDPFILKAPYGMTITDIDCIVVGTGTPTTTIDVKECTNAGASCATVDTTIQCDADGAADDGALTNGVIDADDWVQLDITAVTTTTQVSVTVKYTIVRE